MKLYAIPPLIVSILSIYIGTHHLIIYFKGGIKYKKNLTFAVGCFFIGINDIIISLLYNSTSVYEASFWQTKQPFFYCMATLYMIWFIHDYVKVQIKMLIKILSIIIVTTSFITLISHHKWLWRYEIAEIKTLNLLFDLKIKYYEIAGGFITDLLHIVLIFSMLVTLAWATIKTYKTSQKRSEYFLFLTSFTLFFIGGINDYSVYQGYYQFIYIFEYSFMGIILLMTFSLSNSVIESAVMKDALKSERDLMQSLLDNIPDLIYFKDRKKKYIRINKAFSSLVGFRSPEDIIGKTDFDIFSDKFAEASSKSDEIIVQTKKPLVGKIENEILINGQNRWISSTKVPILDESGELDRIVGISRDITDIKNKEKALKEAKVAAEAANQAKSQFLMNISHELRTPMNGIIGMTTLLNNTPLKEKQKSYLQTIDNCANNLLELLSNLINITDIENEHIELVKKTYNLKVLIDEVVQITKPKITNPNIQFIHQIKPDVPLILKGYKDHTKQILIALLDNACKFTNQGRIKLTICRDNENWETTSVKANGDAFLLKFEISDTGIGIPGDKIDTIFDYFYQLDGSSTRKYGGTGIGLAISKKLTNLMGGKIWVKSELNKGSIFCFKLPSEKAEFEDEPDYDEESANTIPIAYHILIVEDNIVNQKALQYLLEEKKHIVAIANNGLEALNMLRNKKDFDIILMDLQMPTMDGYEATKEIRNSSDPAINSRIPIVAVTAHALDSDRQKCFEIGMDGFVVKPLNIDLLLETIEQVMEKVYVY